MPAQKFKKPAKPVAKPVALDPQAKFSGRTAQAVVSDILAATPVPA